MCGYTLQVIRFRASDSLLRMHQKSQETYSLDKRFGSMEASANLKGIRPGGSGLVRIRGDDALSAMVFPHASSFTGAGCHGSDMAKAGSICISPDLFCCRNSRESSPSAVSRPFLAGQSVVHRPLSLLNSSPCDIPLRRELLSQARGTIYHPQTEMWCGGCGFGP